MNTQGRRAVAILGAVLLLGTAACQEGGNGTQTASLSASVTPPSTSSSSSSSSTSPTPTPSVVIPKAARAHTNEGAVAFAKFFTVAMDEAYVTGDAQPVRALSTKSCKGCVVAFNGIGEMVRAGERQESRAVAIIKADVVGKRQQTVIVHLEVKMTRTPFVDSRGATVGYSEADAGTIQVGLDRADPGWRVSEFATLKSS